MPRKPTGKPSGAPKIKVSEVTSGNLPPKEINLDQVLYWIELQATAEEIAGAFRVSVDTLDNRLKIAFGMGFSDLKKRCSGMSKISLRRFQFQQAEKNASMAIWLGKVWLGQKEVKEEIDVNALSALAQMLQLLQKQRDPKDPADSA